MSQQTRPPQSTFSRRLLAILILVIATSGILVYASFALEADRDRAAPDGSPTPTRTRTPASTATRLPTNTPRPCAGTPTPHPTAAGAPPPAGAIQRQVAHCVDDDYVLLGGVTGSNAGAFYVRTGDAGETGQDSRYIGGFLFRDVAVPQAAQVVSATLRLTRWYQAAAPVVLELAGQLSPQASDFSGANPRPDQRPQTTSRVLWTISNTQDATVNSPNLSGILQEIVGQGGWWPGNDLALLIGPGSAGEQFADWQAFDFSAANAAQLTIRYEPIAATDTPTPTETAAPTATSTLTPTATETATPTATPLMTETPTPTATPGPCIQPPAGLISWWPVEGDANDFVGEHHGTPVGGIGYVPGVVGQAFSFDGMDGSIDLGDWFNLQDFTLAMWVKAGASQRIYADIIDNNHREGINWVVQ